MLKARLRERLSSKDDSIGRSFCIRLPDGERKECCVPYDSKCKVSSYM